MRALFAVIALLWASHTHAMSDKPIDPDAPTLVTSGAFASPGSPWYNHWQEYKATAESNSGGKVKIKLLINGEGGGESSMLTYVRRGRMQVGGFTLAGTASVVPELDVLLAPFFFESFEELDYVMDNYLLEIFRDLLAAKGLYFIQWVEVGWLNMYADAPILVPQDLAGKRMRVQASKAAQTLMLSLGAEYLQMEIADVIPALQTGLVYGGATNVVLYSFAGIAGEASHMSMTRHTVDTGIVVANLNWLNSLPPERRKAVIDSHVATPRARADVRGMARALRAQFEEKGITAHELTPAQRALWREVTAGNTDKIIAQVGGSAQRVYDAMLAGRAAFRAGAR